MLETRYKPFSPQLLDARVPTTRANPKSKRTADAAPVGELLSLHSKRADSTPTPSIRPPPTPLKSPKSTHFHKTFIAHVRQQPLQFIFFHSFSTVGILVKFVALCRGRRVPRDGWIARKKGFLPAENARQPVKAPADAARSSPSPSECRKNARKARFHNIIQRSSCKIDRGNPPIRYRQPCRCSRPDRPAAVQELEGSPDG